MVGVPCSCALLGGFAIGATGFLAITSSAEREMSASACTRSMPGFNCHVETEGLLRSQAVTYAL